MKNPGFNALNLCVLVALGSSFSVQVRFTINHQGMQQKGCVSRPLTTIFSSPIDEDNKNSVEAASPDFGTPAAPKKVVADLEGTQYPIDLPSPILLATSMILAIVGTGTS